MILKNSINVDSIFSNNQILKKIDHFNPTVVAIDAPLIDGPIRIRKADQLMKKYGAMPPTMKSMRLLTKRGTFIAQLLREKGYRVIEVFPTGTAKILGFYEKKYKKSVEKIQMQNIFNNKHEYDAYLCSLTANLYHKRKTKEIGENNETIVLPDKKKVYRK